VSAALFTSLDGGDALAAHLIARIGDAARPRPGRSDLQVMCFALTDPAIAEALVGAARAAPDLTVRLLADWSQGSRTGPALVRRIAAEAPPNLFVKLKLDRPYSPDAEGRLRFSYNASLGFLHHKTVCLRVDRQPVALTCGSMNWSARARQAYETLMTLDDPGDPGEIAIRRAFDAEFEALWGDHRLTATLARADAVRARMTLEGVAPGPADLFGTAGEAAAAASGPRHRVDGPAFAAFSGTPPGEAVARAGFAAANDRRAIDLRRPSGQRRPAPLTLSTLSLEAIRSAPADAQLFVGQYALSPRAPEYGALLAAARRGCRVRLLLDRRIGGRTAAALAAVAAAERLDLTVRTTRRRMHQKYLCCPQTGLFLSGTANMTRDATDRHADHRLLFRDRPDLSARCAEDFERIWARLS
jgi:phosphatidylserine/phosphatidylglycerophosphate/cardiolipin synthase-like enzyme